MSSHFYKYLLLWTPQHLNTAVSTLMVYPRSPHVPSSVGYCQQSGVHQCQAPVYGLKLFCFVGGGAVRDIKYFWKIPLYAVLSNFIFLHIEINDWSLSHWFEMSILLYTKVHAHMAAFLFHCWLLFHHWVYLQQSHIIFIPIAL